MSKILSFNGAPEYKQQLKETAENMGNMFDYLLQQLTLLSTFDSPQFTQEKMDKQEMIFSTEDFANSPNPLIQELFKTVRQLGTTYAPLAKEAGLEDQEQESN